MRIRIPFLAAASVLFFAGSTAAKCPGDNPADPACEPIMSLMMPSVTGTAYIPHGNIGGYWGGGIEAAIASWSHNNNSFGPSQGRLRFDVSYLESTRDKQALFYDIGAIVSFEGNAGRRFLIPYSGVGFGGITETDYGTRLGVDGSLGMFLVYTRPFVLTGEASYFIPFTQVEALRGAMARVTASFALW